MEKKPDSPAFIRAKSKPAKETKAGNRLVWLVGMEKDESFERFKERICESLKAAGILRADGSSNLTNRGNEHDQTKI